MLARSLTRLKQGGALRTIDTVLILSGILILWIGNYSNIDLALADAMFDRASGTSPGATPGWPRGSTMAY